MAQKTVVSGLSLYNNLLVRGLNAPEWQKTIIASDFGFNKIQTLTNIMNKNQSEGISDFKVNVPYVGSTSIANTVNGASVIAGTNLVVTFTQPDNRFRVNDQVMDSNYVKGRVISTTANSITIEPVSVAAWNAATNFTNGMNVSDLGDVSGLGTTTGKTSLTVAPDTDFAVLRKTRDSYDQNIRDRVKTYVQYDPSGKYWWSSQQEFLLKRFARSQELAIVFDDRVENSVSDFNTTGGIRWSAVNNGGTYMPLSSEITEADLQNFMEQFLNNFAAAQKKVIFYCGRRALMTMQNFLKANVITAGTNNVFGGASVKGYDLYMYKIAGLEVTLEYYPLFDDPLFSNQISSITGAPKMSSTIMAVDVTPADSGNGMGSVPVIKQYYHEGVGSEVLYKYIPGMIGSGYDSKTIAMGGADFSLAANDLDACSWQMESVNGVYVIPQKVGWIELTN